jgi:hypothetical protein
MEQLVFASKITSESTVFVLNAQSVQVTELQVEIAWLVT